jgi:hypothetical protein
MGGKGPTIESRVITPKVSSTPAPSSTYTASPTQIKSPTPYPPLISMTLTPVPRCNSSKPYEFSIIPIKGNDAEILQKRHNELISYLSPYKNERAGVVLIFVHSKDGVSDGYQKAKQEVEYLKQWFPEIFEDAQFEPLYYINSEDYPNNTRRYRIYFIKELMN